MSQSVLRGALMGWTGRGAYGHDLDLAFHSLPDVTLVAVSDPDKGGRESAASRLGIVTAYSHYEEMLDREALDLVIVAPHDASVHPEMVTAAARRGLHVFCEKPLAVSLEQADKMVRATADVRGAVAYQNRLWCAPEACRLLQDGFLGRLHPMVGSGKMDHRSGGEVLLVLGTHLLDLMRLFAGDARSVHATIQHAEKPATLSDVRSLPGMGPILGDGLTAFYEFDQGITGIYRSVRAADGGRTSYFRLELHGTEGILWIPMAPTRALYHYPLPVLLPSKPEWRSLPLPPSGGNTPEAPRDLREPPTDLREANRLLALDFIESIRAGRTPTCSIHNARAALEMALAVYPAHLEGRTVRLPLEDRAHPLERGGPS